MWSAEFSQTAQCPCDQDIVLSGKILLITSNLPSLCMYSMIWHDSHTARTKFRCHFNGALHFTLQVLHGNVLCHLAISAPSMPIICRSNTIIPLVTYMTRAWFSMAFQWCSWICMKSTVWESMTHLLTTSIQSRPICWCHALISWQSSSS